MFKNRKLLLGLIICIALLGLLSSFYWKNYAGVRFEGILTELDLKCFHDGICKVKVDDTWIITDLGGDPIPEMSNERGPAGNSLDQKGNRVAQFKQEDIGKSVKVYAKKDNENYTLYGNRNYFIRLLE